MDPSKTKNPHKSRRIMADSLRKIGNHEAANYHEAVLARIQDDPQPSDLAELAALVAKELRKRGIWAKAGGLTNERVVQISRPADCMAHRWHSMLFSDFDNLGPIAIADAIQALEAKRAQEWAGDK